MARERRQYTAEQKLAILREHLIEKKALSAVCDKHEIQPSLFYYWQKQLFEGGAAAFERDTSEQQRKLERQVETLETKLARKDAVIAEVTEEMVKLKKELGEL
jgi:transposase-like protein